MIVFLLLYVFLKYAIDPFIHKIHKLYLSFILF